MPGSRSAGAPPRPTIVLVSLAMNQARFYAGVARELETRGYGVEIISVHEGAAAWLRSRGLAAINFFEHVALPADSLEGLSARAAAFGVENLNRLLSHEKAAYGVRDTHALAAKAVGYLEAMDRILAGIVARSAGPVHVVQELGGFLSVSAARYAAARLGLRHTFMEPAFFRGRVFFTDNSVGAPRVGLGRPTVSRDVVQYIQETRQSRAIVIPAKDQGHYRSAAAKIFNLRSARRLIEKSVEKHLLRRSEEFSHIGTYVNRHFRMLANARRLRRFYQSVPEQPFIYYPLHVPADVALTLRAPEYLDQYALIDFIARTIPVTHKLAFKEHPALVGGIAPERVAWLLRENDNVVLLDPRLNNHDVMRRAAAVVTVNSKSGGEAIMLNRPVVALGDSFYRDTELVVSIEQLSELAAALAGALEQPPREERDILAFFQAVWERSLPGEIFDDDPLNCRVFAESIEQWLGLGRSTSIAAAV